MKKIISRIMFVITFVVLTAPVLSAQEYIRELTTLKDWKTIIREIGTKEWLLYRNYEDERSTFCIVDPYSSASSTLNIVENMVARDFEVLDGKYVYFCGMRVRDTSYWVGDSLAVLRRRNALLGYFLISDITNIPAGSPVPCYLLEDFAGTRLECLNKIEILPVNDGIHLLMTGSTKTGNGCIVDVAAPTLFPSGWNVYVDTSAMGESFDDVAILSNTMVVTSRFNDHSGYVNFFQQPTSYTYTTISSVLYRGKVNYSVDDTLIVKHCENNAFVTGTYSYQHGGLMISGYNYTTPIHSIVLQNITTLAPELQLQDMSYNVDSSTLDVLQHYGNNVYPMSYIWHLDQTLGASGLLINGHKIEETLHSLVCQKNNPGFTVASGRATDVIFFTRYCQLKLNYFEFCSESIKIPYVKSDHKLTDDEYLVGRKSGEGIPQLTPASNYPWPISDICPSPDCMK